MAREVPCPPRPPLLLSACSHVMPGAYWGRHRREALVSVGRTPVPGWESLPLAQRTHTLVLGVYADDFELPGGKGPREIAGTP